MEAIELKKFSGMANEVSLEFLMENISLTEKIELFTEERIIHLPIRWGELFHKCNEAEWADINSYLIKNSIPLKKKAAWKLW
jgi:hypothetical protein|tara:strand:- start:324 stop:569 length:246 start_codon:yes stop_codon:yes gene_type:complete